MNDRERLRMLAEAARDAGSNSSRMIDLEKACSPAAILALLDERDALERDRDRLQAAHDHQYSMAGLMLREAERAGRERDAAYDRLDRFLRNNLDDADYAEYSKALDSVAAPPAPSLGGFVVESSADGSGWHRDGDVVHATPDEAFAAARDLAARLPGAQSVRIRQLR